MCYPVFIPTIPLFRGHVSFPTKQKIQRRQYANNNKVWEGELQTKQILCYDSIKNLGSLAGYFQVYNLNKTKKDKFLYGYIDSIKELKNDEMIRFHNSLAPYHKSEYNTNLPCVYVKVPENHNKDPVTKLPIMGKRYKENLRQFGLCYVRAITQLDDNMYYECLTRDPPGFRYNITKKELKKYNKWQETMHSNNAIYKKLKALEKQSLYTLLMQNQNQKKLQEVFGNCFKNQKNGLLSKQCLHDISNFINNIISHNELSLMVQQKNKTQKILIKTLKEQKKKANEISKKIGELVQKAKVLPFFKSEENKEHLNIMENLDDVVKQISSLQNFDVQKVKKKFQELQELQKKIQGITQNTNANGKKTKKKKRSRLSAIQLLQTILLNPLLLFKYFLGIILLLNFVFMNVPDYTQVNIIGVKAFMEPIIESVFSISNVVQRNIEEGSIDLPPQQRENPALEQGSNDRTTSSAPSDDGEDYPDEEYLYGNLDLKNEMDKFLRSSQRANQNSSNKPNILGKKIEEVTQQGEAVSTLEEGQNIRTTSSAPSDDGEDYSDEEYLNGNLDFKNEMDKFFASFERANQNNLNQPKIKRKDSILKQEANKKQKEEKPNARTILSRQEFLQLNNVSNLNKRNQQILNPNFEFKTGTKTDKIPESTQKLRESSWWPSSIKIPSRSENKNFIENSGNFVLNAIGDSCDTLDNLINHQLDKTLTQILQKGNYEGLIERIFTFYPQYQDQINILKKLENETLNNKQKEMIILAMLDVELNIDDEDTNELQKEIKNDRYGSNREEKINNIEKLKEIIEKRRDNEIGNLPTKTGSLKEQIIRKYKNKMKLLNGTIASLKNQNTVVTKMMIGNNTLHLKRSIKDPNPSILSFIII